MGCYRYRCNDCVHLANFGAAVASAVIVQTAEKLQQNAQRAGDDTSDELSGKLTIMQGFQKGGEYVSMLDLHQVAIQFLRLHVSFQLFCDMPHAGTVMKTATRYR